MSKLWYGPSVFILLCVGLPPLAALAGASPSVFGVYLLGLAASVVFGILLASMSAFGSATARPWRPMAVRASIVPLLVAFTLGIPGYRAASQNPIHDVTTDADLTFPADSGAVANPADRGVDPKEVLAVQRELYPDVEPLTLDTPPDQTFERAAQAARAMPGWDVVDARPQSGLILAVVTSPTFHFKDDVVIRVRESGAGSRVDMRSRSRFGQSDLGANAARIKAYLAELG